MLQAEFEKMVDAWLEKESENKGEETITPLGPYPVDSRGFYGQQMNEWITTDLIRHYAASLGDRNPLWWREDYAGKTRWGGIIAPPTITDSIGMPSGPWREPPSTAEYRFSRVVGGCKREWSQVIRPGDKFRCVDKWLGIEERKSKEPRPYRLFVDTHQRAYINQKDETVAVVDNRFMIRAFLESSGAGAHPAPKIHKFTEDEIKAIYRSYEEGKRRGGETLFWEDVAEGEELKPYGVNYSSWDAAAFLGATPGQAVAFDIGWEWLKAGIPFNQGRLDPENNIMRWAAEGHLKFLAYGAQIEGLLSRLVCDWMGDDGFLKKLDCQFRIPGSHGDALWLKGKVTGKATVDGEHLVDLEVHCENHDGVTLVPGTATVRLPSRTQS